MGLNHSLRGFLHDFIHFREVFSSYGKIQILDQSIMLRYTIHIVVVGQNTRKH